MPKLTLSLNGLSHTTQRLGALNIPLHFVRIFFFYAREDKFTCKPNKQIQAKRDVISAYLACITLYTDSSSGLQDLFVSSHSNKSIITAFASFFFFSFSRPDRMWSLLVYVRSFLFSPVSVFKLLSYPRIDLPHAIPVIALLSGLTAADTTEAHIHASCEEILPCCQSKVELRSPFSLLLLGNHTGVLYGDSCPTPDQTPRCPWCDTAVTSRATQSVMWKHRETPSPGQTRQGRLSPPQCHTRIDPAELKTGKRDSDRRRPFLPSTNTTFWTSK